jgi:hypothetical protein
MDENTVFTYENAIGKLIFEYVSPLWITEIDGISSVEIDIAESRSTQQVGSSITAQSVKPRSFTINGAIFEPIAHNRQQLLAIIAPQIPSTLTIKQGTEEAWYLDVVPERTPEITAGVGVQFFQTRLHSAYPYWRTIASYATQITGLASLFMFPFYTGGEWYISEFSDSFFSTVQNKGNVPVEFQITFTARSALTNPEIYHVGTGKRILIRKTMVADEQVIVSTIYGSKGIVCISPAGERTNGFKYLSIDSDLSMALIPGDNTLRINADTNREGLEARIDAPQGVKSGV